MSKRICITVEALPIPEPAPKEGEVLEVKDTNDRGWWVDYPAGRPVLVLYREAVAIEAGRDD